MRPRSSTPAQAFITALKCLGCEGLARSPQVSASTEIRALETGRTFRTAVLDAVRLEPGADVAAVTTIQIREVVERLVAAGQCKPGDPEVLVVLDAGYDAPRIAHLLGDLPVQTLGRLRSDRVMRRPTPPRCWRSLNLALAAVA